MDKELRNQWWHRFFEIEALLSFVGMVGPSVWGGIGVMFSVVVGLWTYFAEWQGPKGPLAVVLGLLTLCAFLWLWKLVSEKGFLPLLAKW